LAITIVRHLDPEKCCSGRVLTISNMPCLHPLATDEQLVVRCHLDTEDLDHLLVARVVTTGMTDPLNSVEHMIVWSDIGDLHPSAQFSQHFSRRMETRRVTDHQLAVALLPAVHRVGQRALGLALGQVDRPQCLEALHDPLGIAAVGVGAQDR